ncbi:MAG: DUF2238 domain-containing protein [Bacilli bacterium]|nr:DUF2238 domain-containing protein [Bacilli bacterium]
MKRINVFLILIMISYSLYISYFDFINNNIYDLLIDLAIIIVIFIPKIIRKTFKFNIDKITEYIYIIFIFVAYFLGSVLNFYNNISWYDTFAHFISGIVFGFLTLELLVQINKYDKKNIFFNILFIISMSFLIAGIWEYFEFITDIIFNKDAQKVVLTGVSDTMKDMMSATLGTALFCIYIWFKNKKNIK